jgi:predicted enzyme related to lactoylglutathione lyase
MRYPNGFFGWVDLVSTDVPAAKAFYSGLFGWETEDIPTPMGPAYTMCRLGGQLVAGIGPQPPGMAEAGVPSMWNSYLMVEDVDATCAAVAAAGGAVVMPAMDVMTEGRMAMVADPSGAVVGLWQPRDHQGADLFNAPGALTWNELQSRDLDAATGFYTQVFGWRWEEAPDSGGYLMAMLDTKEGEDKSNGGAMTMPDMVPAEVPSYWAVYFAVEDCDATFARATGLGADGFLPPMEMGPGRFAGVTDPTGASVMFGNFPPS